MMKQKKVGGGGGGLTLGEAAMGTTSRSPRSERQGEVLGHHLGSETAKYHAKVNIHCNTNDTNTLGRPLSYYVLL